MITREWKGANLNEAFFPVTMASVSWSDNEGNFHKISGQYAIIDFSTKKTFSVVSDRYHLILNKEAYDFADAIIRGVFEGFTLSDFECFNIYMPKTRGSCRIDLIIPHNFNNPFGDPRENWTPFVRISNSYNKTLVLKYEIGFCRWICLNGVIFGQKGITIKFVHTDEINPKTINLYILKAQQEIGNIRNLWNAFENKLLRLKEIPLPSTMALPMFCKAFGLEIDETKVSKSQKENFKIKAQKIITSSKEYFAELGNNAYALFNVLTDFASFSEGVANPHNFIHGYQRKVGDWVDNIVTESSKPDFSLYKYIGEAAMNSAFFLESLVENRQ